MKSGGNITSAAEMKAALDSENGVTGCQVAHVEVGNSDDIIISQKIRGLTKISNVQFNYNHSITYWKNYNIGKGQTISMISHHLNSTLTVVSDFKPPVNFYGTITKPITALSENDEDNHDVELHCPDPQCDVILRSYSSLNDHCLIGNHHYLSTFDAIRMKWKETCLDVTSTAYKRTSDAYASSAPENTLMKGWALKRDRKNTRFSDNVKEF